MALPRPMFQTMWHHFVTVYGDGSVPSVGKIIGGKVQENIDLGVKDPKAGFTNACAIRMSYSLNNSGITISRGVWKTVSGGDKKQYIYRVSDLIKFIIQTFGKPDKTVKNPKPSDFVGVKGLLILVCNGAMRQAMPLYGMEVPAPITAISLLLRRRRYGY